MMIGWGTLGEALGCAFTIKTHRNRGSVPKLPGEIRVIGRGRVSLLSPRAAEIVAIGFRLTMLGVRPEGAYRTALAHVRDRGRNRGGFLIVRLGGGRLHVAAIDSRPARDFFNATGDLAADGWAVVDLTALRQKVADAFRSARAGRP